MPGYGKYRSPEEKEEFVKQLGADAKQRVIDLAENWEADAKDVAEFLIFSSRFPDYSVRNQMLIYKQNPYAMFTAGYNQFEKMGYTVQKGEKGMRIWVPHNITYYRGKESEPWKRLTKSTPKAVRDMIKAGMLETREELQFYRYGVVFDIAQTNCPAEDYPKLVGLGCADELHAAAFDIISEYSNRCGMPVRTIDLKSVALRGYYESETCNIIIMDPKGELLRDIGNVFKAEGYKIRVFDLIDMLSSFRYNPFIYFKRESDIQGFITNLFANTEDKTKHGGDAFWDKTAKMMLSALMYYVWYECPETEMNFGTVMELILAETVEEGDEAGISATQVLIEELRARSPRHIAVRYFDAYRKGAGETIMSIQESLLSRLEKFLLEDVVNLTTGDELELEKIGEEKTALFIRMPDDNSFHFLASALITQLFQLMMAQADARSTGSLPVPVHFVLEEARNITLPDSFQNWVATMRSRNITLSIILQNISQIKRMFPDDWESVSGMCDEILYLGGNEQSTHEWISKAMGQETIDNRSYGTTHSWTSGSNSTNEQNSGRALMDVTEVRLKNKLLKGKIGSVIMILADERPIIDEKYDLNRHPRIKLSADGGAPQYSYVSSELLPETNTIQINETDVDEDEVDGVFTFDLQNVELN